MWRPILIGIVLCILWSAASAAQIERNLDSRSRAEGGARRRPSAGQTHVRKPVAGQVRLNVAQRALTVEIVVACRKAGVRAIEFEALRQRAAVRSAGARLAQHNQGAEAEAPAVLEALPEEVAAVASSPQPVAAAPAETGAVTAPAAAPTETSVPSAPVQSPPAVAADTTVAAQPEVQAAPAVEQPALPEPESRPAEGNSSQEISEPGAAPAEPAAPEPAIENPVAVAETAAAQEPAAGQVIPQDAKSAAPPALEESAPALEPRSGVSSGEGRRPETNSLDALAEARRAPVQIEDIPATDSGKPGSATADETAAEPPIAPAAEEPSPLAEEPAAEDDSAASSERKQAFPELLESAGQAEAAEPETENRRPDISRWGHRAREKQQQETAQRSVDNLLEDPALDNEEPAVEPEPATAAEATTENPTVAEAAAVEPGAAETAAAEPTASEDDFYSGREPQRWQRAMPPEPPLKVPEEPAALAPPEEPAGTSLEQLKDLGRSPAEPPTVASAAILPAPKAPRGLVLSVAEHASRLGGGLPAAPVELVLPALSASQPAIKLPAGLAAISRGNPKKKLVALTFDDGPHPYYTSQLLAVLAYYKTPATFFFVGIQAQKYPQWVKMTHQAGHEIGSHTYDHFRLPKLPPAEQAYQIDEYQRLIEGLTGSKPRFLRPPGGNVDENLKQLIAKRGMVVALWDVALNDTAQDKTADQLLKSTLKSVRPGSIILSHDGVQATINMLPQLITRLRRDGYTFVTMSELAAGL